MATCNNHIVQPRYQQPPRQNERFKYLSKVVLNKWQVIHINTRHISGKHKHTNTENELRKQFARFY